MEKNRKEEAKKAMAEKKEEISQKMRKNVEHSVIVMSGKGGVGKSTVAANIATALTMRGHEVGLMDCDMHGPSIPKIVGISYDKRPTDTGDSLNPVLTDFGLNVMSLGSLLPEKDSPVVWRGPLKMRTIQQFLGDVNWGKLDYLVFDLPPGTGDEPLSIAQLIPDPDGTAIITTPQEVALQTIRRSVNFAKKVDLPVLGLIENMSGFVCPNCGSEIDIFRSGGGEELSEELGVPLLGKVPLDPEIVESGEKGKPVVLEGRSKAAKAFEDITSEIESSVSRAEKKDVNEELEQIKREKIEEIKRPDSEEPSKYPNSPIKVTDANLSELAEKYRLLVVDCWAEWCAPCGPMGEIIDDLAEKFSGRIAFGKLNVDRNRETAMNYQISSIPQLLIFRTGKVVDRIVGLRPKEKIGSELRKYI